ncbi:MAG: TonB-dependent receptor [Prevotella sp.]|nr:TonB-dependent receptor [Prevotella sp.]
MALLCTMVIPSFAQKEKTSAFDSIQHVDEVVVLSNLTFREVIPSHTLKGEQLERLNSHSIADALRYFAGVQLKDYGGVGGIKTINVRSMGSNHLGIYYDGIQLGNAQNGQIDLGQFSMDNVEEISLYNGQKSAIFQPASEFGNAGTVYIRTRRPHFSNGEHTHLKTRVKYGSSDLIRFSTLWEQRLSASVTSSVGAEVMNASGKYKFRYRRYKADGSLAYDTTATRQNGDVWAVRAEGNLYGAMEQGGWNVKAYTYHSERGIPGAIVNNVWRRGERQADHNTFFQAGLLRNLSDRFSSRLQAKYAYYVTHYVNRDPKTMLVDNTYKQQELFLSTSNVYEIMRGWSASVAYDFKWNKLREEQGTRNKGQEMKPYRFSNMVSVATAYNQPWMNIQGSLLATFVKDHFPGHNDKKSENVWTPAVFFNIFPLRNKNFSVRAYAKRSFRMPTFNDLYYTEMGNAMLKPETALQYNVGAVYVAPRTSHLASRISHFRLQVDAYYNTIHDKIVAYPKGQQFRWTMLNLGKVHIKGIDVETELEVRAARELTLGGRLQYTYQDARDVTDPTDTYYNHQIPYIPWHSGSAIFSASYRQWDFNYSFIYAGKRYNQQENIDYNYMPAWYTSDLSLMYRFRWVKTRCKATLEVNNLLDQQYDVILNYPMPGRNYAISMEVEI